MIRFVLAVLTIAVLDSQASAQPSSYPLYQNIYGSQFANPDSVRVDTNQSSSSYGHLFAKGRFGIFFDYNIIPLDSVRSDSLLLVGLDAVDSNFEGVLNVLSAIQLHYGKITFQKQYPQIGDSNYRASNEFFLSFDSLVDVDSVLSALRTISLMHSGFASQPVGTSTIPSDLGMVPGASSSSVFSQSGWPPDFHQLGWQWALFKMKCPMAWEITKG
jgi:hypothetical protein